MVVINIAITVDSGRMFDGVLVLPFEIKNIKRRVKTDVTSVWVSPHNCLHWRIRGKPPGMQSNSTQRKCKQKRAALVKKEDCII